MFVLDASVALAWCLPDETNAAADAVLDRLGEEGAVVPAIWPAELANAIRTAERRGRLHASDVVRLRGFLAALPITVVPLPVADALGDVLTLARASGLSAYDASYLAVAATGGLPLATFDASLADACRAVGIELVA